MLFRCRPIETERLSGDLPVHLTRTSIGPILQLSPVTIDGLTLILMLHLATPDVMKSAHNRYADFVNGRRQGLRHQSSLGKVCHAAAGV